MLKAVKTKLSKNTLFFDNFGLKLIYTHPETVNNRFNYINSHFLGEPPFSIGNGFFYKSNKKGVLR